jgi:hypothetical protein
MVAANLANMKHGGDRKSDQAANLQAGRVSQEEAAKKLNVSTRSVATAKKVKESAPASPRPNGPQPLRPAGRKRYENYHGFLFKLMMWLSRNSPSNYTLKARFRIVRDEIMPESSVKQRADSWISCSALPQNV